MHPHFDGVDQFRSDQTAAPIVDFAQAPLDECAAALPLLCLAGGEDADALPWHVLATRFPDAIAGNEGIARLLRRYGKHDEADAALATAMGLRPNVHELALDYALAAFERREWAESVARLAAVIGRFPDLAIARGLMIDSLIGLAALDAAAQVGRVAVALFPDDIDIAFATARLATATGDAAAAVTGWRAVCARFEHHPDAHAELARSLRAEGDGAGARDVLTAGLALFADHVAMLKLRAIIAGEAGDWVAALQHWSDLVERLPGDAECAAYRATAEGRVAGEGPAVVAASVDPPPVAPERALFMGFESLGHSCEFGLVQRHFGAEPIGLLRWTGIDPDELLAALIEKFEGVGDPAETEVIVSDDTYLTMHARYYMQSHTFIKTSDAEPQAVFEQQCRRLGFLRRKLLVELAAGRRIFVYAHGEQLSDTMVAALDAAIRGYNETSVTLFVRPSDLVQIPGTVRRHAERCFIGALSHFETGAPAHDEWLAICRAVRDATDGGDA